MIPSTHPAHHKMDHEQGQEQGHGVVLHDQGEGYQQPKTFRIGSS